MYKYLSHIVYNIIIRKVKEKKEVDSSKKDLKKS